MRVRSRMLPAGWYPTSQSRCVKDIEEYVAGVSPLPIDTRVYGGMVPHAGWYFSGKLAARVFFLTSRTVQPQVVCIFGGHLPPDSPPLLTTEDAWETPLGDLPLATECFQPLRKRLKLQEDVPGDNTIEIQLPFVKHFFPQAKLLAVRAPHSPKAMELGEAVLSVAQELKLTILAFGSTDLTHYGPNYGWAPKGFGIEAVKWVKEVNDKRFLDLALKLDSAGLLKAAEQDQCACSPGGAAASVAAAKKAGATKALLVDYYTSYDIMPGDSFVGYGGLIWAG
jgi:AmmeMemoRadiSam system protein B